MTKPNIKNTGSEVTSGQQSNMVMPSHPNAHLSDEDLDEVLPTLMKSMLESMTPGEAETALNELKNEATQGVNHVEAEIHHDAIAELREVARGSHNENAGEPQDPLTELMAQSAKLDRTVKALGRSHNRQSTITADEELRNKTANKYAAALILQRELSKAISDGLKK